MIHPKIDSDRPQLVSMDQAKQMVLQERERCAGIADKERHDILTLVEKNPNLVETVILLGNADTAGLIANAIRKGYE